MMMQTDSSHSAVLGSVFSVSIDKSGAFACSGGEDDVGLLWKISDGSVVLNCQGKNLITTSSLPQLPTFPRSQRFCYMYWV